MASWSLLSLINHCEWKGLVLEGYIFYTYLPSDNYYFPSSISAIFGYSNKCSDTHPSVEVCLSSTSLFFKHHWLHVYPKDDKVSTQDSCQKYPPFRKTITNTLPNIFAFQLFLFGAMVFENIYEPHPLSTVAMSTSTASCCSWHDLCWDKNKRRINK